VNTILDITQFFSESSGGVRRYLLEKRAACKALNRFNHVLVVPGRETKREIDPTHPHFVTFYLKGYRISPKSNYRLLTRLTTIITILREVNPSLVEIGCPYHVGLYTLKACQKREIPVTAYYHSNFPDSYLRGFPQFLGRRLDSMLPNLAYRYVKWLYNQVQVTLCAANATSQMLRSKGVEKVKKIPFYVNPKKFYPVNSRQQILQKLGIEKNKRVLLYVGRLAHEKGTLLLLGLMRELQKREKAKYHLIIVGEGHLRDKIQYAKKTMGEISLHPYIKETALLREFYSAADLFVHPGRKETFGLVALEAQACGCPVIGFHGSGLAEAIYAENGNIVPLPQNPTNERLAKCLSDAIQAVFQNDLKNCGNKAREWTLNQFSLENTYGKLFDLYDDIIQGNCK